MDRSTKFWDRIAVRYSKKPVADEESYQKKLKATRKYFLSDMDVLEFGCCIDRLKSQRSTGPSSWLWRIAGSGLVHRPEAAIYNPLQLVNISGVAWSPVKS